MRVSPSDGRQESGLNGTPDSKSRFELPPGTDLFGTLTDTFPEGSNGIEPSKNLFYKDVNNQPHWNTQYLNPTPKANASRNRLRRAVSTAQSAPSATHPMMTKTIFRENCPGRQSNTSLVGRVRSVGARYP